jgi:hypothetical protein
MSAPPVPHAAYGTEEPVYRALLKINNLLKPAFGRADGP